MIPKTLHIIWVADDSKRPDKRTQTWAQHNPGWHIKLWGNDDLVLVPELLEHVSDVGAFLAGLRALKFLGGMSLLAVASKPVTGAACGSMRA